MSDSELRTLSEGDWTKEELYCTPDGQVLLMHDQKSVFEINADIERQLQSEREKKWQNLSAVEKRSLIRTTIGSRVALPKNQQITTVETIQRDGYSIQKLKLAGTEEQLALPGLLFVPETLSKPPVLLLDGVSMQTEAGPGGLCERYVKQGRLVTRRQDGKRVSQAYRSQEVRGELEVQLV